MNDRNTKFGEDLLRVRNQVRQYAKHSLLIDLTMIHPIAKGYIPIPAVRVAAFRQHLHALQS